MEIEIRANGWTAYLLASDHFDDLCHVTCNTRGSSKESALAGAEWVLRILTQGRRTFVRCRPEAMSEKDFDSKEMRHAGFTRFSFSLEPGELMFAAEPVKLSLSGVEVKYG